MSVYGYCRISTPQQNIERQVRNIAATYPEAHIVREVYTGTACQGRRELDKLLHTVQPGDTIVFDSVSRMSRSAEEGCALYEALYKRGVDLCFLKEPHINTDTYKQALQRALPQRADGSLDGEAWLALNDEARFVMKQLAPERVAAIARLRDAAVAAKTGEATAKSAAFGASASPKSGWLGKLWTKSA